MRTITVLQTPRDLLKATHSPRMNGDTTPALSGNAEIVVCGNELRLSGEGAKAFLIEGFGLAELLEEVTGRSVTMEPPGCQHCQTSSAPAAG
jgi:hypothetical protein